VPAVSPASPVSKYSKATAVVVGSGGQADTELDIDGGFARVWAFTGPGVLTYVDESRHVVVVTAPFVCIWLRYADPENINDWGRSDFGCGRANVSVARDLSTASADGVISSDAYFAHAFRTPPTHTPSSISFSVTWTASSPCALEAVSLCDPLSIGSSASGRPGIAEGHVTSSVLGIEVADAADWSYVAGYCCVWYQTWLVDQLIDEVG
jgi:hypothetical protein